MKLGLVTLLVAMPAIAAPAPDPAIVKAVEATVKANLDGLAAKADNAKLRFAKGAVIVLGSEDKTPDMSVWGVLAPLGGKITLTREPQFTSTAYGVAWFQQSYQQRVEPEKADPAVKAQDSQFRASGLAIQVGGAWQLAGMHYAQLVPDSVLVGPDNPSNYAVRIPKDAPITGDRELGTAVKSWIANGFTGYAASQGDNIASGTSPTEHATSDPVKVAELTKTWDGLKLQTSRVLAKTFAGGKVGFASAEVVWPRKGGKPIRMMLTVVAVKDGVDGWRWVALQFSA